MPNKKRILHILLLSLGTIFVMAMAFLKTDFSLFFKSFIQIRISLLPLLILNLLLMWFFGVISLYVLILPLKKIPIGHFALDQMFSILLGAFTPGNAGESAIILLLKKENINLQKGTSLFLLNKIVNLLLILISGLCFLFYLKINVAGLLIGVALMIGIVLVCVYTPLRSVIAKKILKRYFSRLLDFFRTFSDLLKVYHRAMLVNIGLNICKVILVGTSVYITFLIFHLHIDYIPLLTSVNLARIMGLIPITPAGWGIVEGGTSVLLSHLGYDKTIILAGMFFMRTLNLLLSLIIGIILLLIRRSIKKNKNHRNLRV